MVKKHKVVGIGEILWDMPPQGKVLGGAPANFVYHAAQMGAEGHIISAVGNDHAQKNWWEVAVPTFISTIKVDDCNITAATE